MITNVVITPLFVHIQVDEGHILPKYAQCQQMSLNPWCSSFISQFKVRAAISIAEELIKCVSKNPPGW